MKKTARHDFSENNQALTGTEAGALRLAKTRLLLMIGGFFLGYLAVTLRLTELTLLRTVTEEEVAVRPALIAPEPLRGTILDRNGELMATTLTMASIYADATQIENPQVVARDIADILPQIKAADLAGKLAEDKKFIWISRNITPRQEYAINKLGHPGIGFKQEDRRIYPHGNLTAHLLGYTDVDGRGIAGVERAFDKQLSEGAEDLRLTIDLRIQHILHKELSAAQKKFSALGATGIVMDVNSGEIIAAVSLPDFDPYDPRSASDEQKFSRATLGVYEMGSTFKIFSTAAALDSGKVSFQSTFDAIEPIKRGRFTISDFHPKRRVLTLPEVFMYSSNIGTAKMALTMGEDRLRDYYEDFGFFNSVPVDISEKGLPIYHRRWTELSAITTSFGHGISVTPLHVLRAVAAVVNGGILIRPQIVKPANASALSLVPRGERILTPQTSAKMRQLLELVVADGTGANAYVEGYHVGGKTGTAEKSVGKKGYDKNARISSFIGVFPIQNPRYAVLALIDEPQAIKETHGYATGGWVAAPVVSTVIAQMGPLYQIPPDFDQTRNIQDELKPYLKDIKKKGAHVAAQATR